ncbi:GL23607 [Drosophila persimilis]|uniref:GL23607 n=1 Tax=Drosophila persimilis TaxID=7234 RepID=B4G2H3_DROPE|nr:GL23607 [Drosophila persimilis]
MELKLTLKLEMEMGSGNADVYDSPRVQSLKGLGHGLGRGLRPALHASSVDLPHATHHTTPPPPLQGLHLRHQHLRQRQQEQQQQHQSEKAKNVLIRKTPKGLRVWRIPSPSAGFPPAPISSDLAREYCRVPGTQVWPQTYNKLHLPTRGDADMSPCIGPVSGSGPGWHNREPQTTKPPPLQPQQQQQKQRKQNHSSSRRQRQRQKQQQQSSGGGGKNT